VGHVLMDHLEGPAVHVTERSITANAVAPGIIATPMTAALFDAAAIEQLVPLNRAGCRKKSRRWWRSSPRRRLLT
jgi:NAD(P)-dependent dehydrogenase (short-subunit alcohol dehydrogenase family)